MNREKTLDYYSYTKLFVRNLETNKNDRKQQIIIIISRIRPEKVISALDSMIVPPCRTPLNRLIVILNDIVGLSGHGLQTLIEHMLAERSIFIVKDKQTTNNSLVTVVTRRALC